MTTRKNYTAEFKRQAIELAAREEVGPSRAARNLGISLSALSRWRKQAEKQGSLAFPGHGGMAMTPQEQDLQRLRKENKILCQEREILKKQRPVLARTAPVWGLASSLPKKFAEVRGDERAPQRISLGHHVPNPASLEQWLSEMAKKTVSNAKNRSQSPQIAG